MTVPQVVGMYKNDRTRKEILVDFGFRLPSALDNRPLTFEEFEKTVHQAIYMSATPGPYELERSQRDRPAAHPADRDRRSAHRGPPDRGPDRRPARGDPRAGRAGRARPGHDPDQEDGRGPDRLPQGTRGQGPVPPQRGGHARARRDPARPAPRGLRRPGRDQPPARGDRPARGHARRDPRRGQGGLPAVRLVAHPDDRPRGAQHRRGGRDVRRPGHRVDAGRDRRDGPPPGHPGGRQPGPRDPADDDHQGDPRPQRAPAGRGRVDDRVHLGEGRGADRRPTGPRWRPSSPGWRRR